MYDVDDLENRWKIYRSKRRYAWYIFIIVELLVAIYIVNISKINSRVVKYIKDNNLTHVFDFSKKDTTLMDKKDDTNKSLKKEKDIKIEDSDVQRDIDKEHKRKYLKIELTDKYSKKVETDSIDSDEDNNIYFDDLQMIRDIKIKFSKNKNYKDSLRLAEIYYRDGQYTESEKWALITNNLNSDIEEGWLIFVKSKMKMGDYEEAQEVLDVYIKKTNSKEAKKLLDEIKRDKF
jgi:tetratricopeptide (TPR) repeat protein